MIKLILFQDNYLKKPITLLDRKSVSRTIKWLELNRADPDMQSKI